MMSITEPLYPICLLSVEEAEKKRSFHQSEGQVLSEHKGGGALNQDLGGRGSSLRVTV